VQTNNLGNMPKLRVPQYRHVLGAVEWLRLASNRDQ
jgi:hypothetical protein